MTLAQRFVNSAYESAESALEFERLSSPANIEASFRALESQLAQEARELKSAQSLARNQQPSSDIAEFMKAVTELSDAYEAHWPDYLLSKLRGKAAGAFTRAFTHKSCSKA